MNTVYISETKKKTRSFVTLNTFAQLWPAHSLIVIGMWTKGCSLQSKLSLQVHLYLLTFQLSNEPIEATGIQPRSIIVREVFDKVARLEGLEAITASLSLINHLSSANKEEGFLKGCFPKLWLQM